MGSCNSAHKDSLFGYIYIPKSDVNSVIKYGLLSARAQSELIPENNNRIIEKYETQLQEALEKFDPELRNYIEKHSDGTRIGNILVYLDWRDEETLKGSKAIYFLFYPVPRHKTILRHIERYRENFLKDRVLISFPISRNKKIYTIGTYYSAKDLNSEDENFWVEQWLKAIQHDKAHKDKKTLWFSGIPHAYIIPNDGKISPDDISIYA